MLPRLREGSLDLAVVASLGEFSSEEFDARRISSEPLHVVVSSDHPVLAKPDAVDLSRLEWVLSSSMADAHSPKVAAMFDAAGVAPPKRLVVAEALSAWTLVRECGLVSLFPDSMLGRPEVHGIVAVDAAPFNAGEVEMAVIARPDVPLTPAAAYFSRCLCDAGAGLPSPLTLD